jgi:regulator of protease activity HflC (stomatin/prohibitin superfamily)
MDIANILQTGVILLWVGVIALIIIIVARSSRGQNTKNLTSLVLILVVVAILLSVVSAGLVFIQPEERGVVISALAGGVRSEPLGPGLKWVVPFFESVKTYQISRQTYTMSIVGNEGQREGDDSITARTLDGQEVLIDASIIYAIDPGQVVKVHIDWQDRYGEELVRPQARGVIRDAVSQYGVEEVVSTKRDEMSSKIDQNLAEKLRENGLILLDFVLRNITFSPEYAASVEQKQISEQQAQQAKLIVEQRKQEAEQARQQAQGLADSVIIRAKGDAESRLIQAEAEKKALELIQQAIKDNPELLSYLYINKIAPGIQVMLLPNNTPLFYSLPTLTPGSNLSLPTLEPTPAPTPTPASPQP